MYKAISPPSIALRGGCTGCRQVRQAFKTTLNPGHEVSPGQENTDVSAGFHKQMSMYVKVEVIAAKDLGQGSRLQARWPGQRRGSANVSRGFLSHMIELGALCRLPDNHMGSLIILNLASECLHGWPVLSSS